MATKRTASKIPKSPVPTTSDGAQQMTGKAQWKSIPGLLQGTVALGQQLKRFREAKSLTLEKLSEFTKQRNPANRAVTAAQISRIENGLIAPDLPELQLLCLALECDLRDLFQPAPKPWFVVRKTKAEEWLQDILSGKRVVKRETGRHQKLIESEVYRYVPLEDDLGTQEAPGLVLPKERAGMLNPLMRKNLLIVGRLNEQEIEKALDSHPGEEIVFILQGELEFWFRGQGDDSPRSLDLPLGPGDCLHFSSELLHAFRATGKETVRAFQVFCEAGGTRRDFYGQSTTKREF
jgi:transcriptional regulator with XRE-family HTH domain